MIPQHAGQISNDSLLETVLFNEPELCVVMNRNNKYLWDLGKRLGVLGMYWRENVKQHMM